jgi:hypothetical protein
LSDTAVNPDRPCPHRTFFVQADVYRLGEEDPGSGGAPMAYNLEIQVRCEDEGCGEKFRFNGVRAGLSQQHPMCNVDETVLNAPIRPASADPDFGQGIPGFAIQVVKR